MLIDLMADDKGRRECFALIREFYKTTLNQDLATSSYYEIYERAKSKWLTNLSLPNIENYKKAQLAKSEMLEEEIRLNSSKDIVDQAKVFTDIWKYNDNIVGINQQSSSDSVIISINMDAKKSINALDFDDE